MEFQTFSPQRSTKTEEPVGWPENLIYLTKPVYSPCFKPYQLASLRVASPNDFPDSTIRKVSRPSPSTLVLIKRITDPTHPACGQFGLFAAQHLPPSSFIVPYLGFVHTSSIEDTDESSNYDLTLDRELSLAIDARSQGNEARFINDYRGVAQKPNAEFRECYYAIDQENGKQGSKFERTMGVYVLSPGKAGLRKKGIREGEEILVSYGRGFWKSREDENDNGERLIDMIHPTVPLHY